MPQGHPSIERAYTDEMNCWICGAPATTGEHRMKHSDLRALLGKPTPAEPLYFHDATRSNRKLRSFKADILKSARFCTHKGIPLTGRM